MENKLFDENVQRFVDTTGLSFDEVANELSTFEQVIRGVAENGRKTELEIRKMNAAYSPRHASGGKSLHQKAVERRRKRKNGGPK